MHVSGLSVWELLLKHHHGKLDLPSGSLIRAIESAGVVLLTRHAQILDRAAPLLGDLLMEA